MRRIEAVIFDLDGTLTDSKKNIYKAIMAAFKEMGISATIDEKEFEKYIGWHFQEIFEDLEINIGSLDKFIYIYKSYYYKFLDYSTFYPGVVSTIKKLYQNGIKVCLLTTKAQDQADYIIDHFGLRKYFTYVMGRRPGIPNKPAPDPLLILCNDIMVKPENAVMVGDTEMDINCGKAAGTISIAVTYGYRKTAFLMNLKSDFIINNINEIFDKLEL